MNSLLLFVIDSYCSQIESDILIVPKITVEVNIRKLSNPEPYPEIKIFISCPRFSEYRET